MVFLRNLSQFWCYVAKIDAPRFSTRGGICGPRSHHPPLPPSPPRNPCVLFPPSLAASTLPWLPPPRHPLVILGPSGLNRPLTGAGRAATSEKLASLFRLMLSVYVVAWRRVAASPCSTLTCCSQLYLANHCPGHLGLLQRHLAGSYQSTELVLSPRADKRYPEMVESFDLET